MKKFLSMAALVALSASLVAVTGCKGEEKPAAPPAEAPKVVEETPATAAPATPATGAPVTGAEAPVTGAPVTPATAAPAAPATK